jgi:DnaJ-class molecular chaperone
MIKTIKTPCSMCSGRGWVVQSNRDVGATTVWTGSCSDCKGKGYHERAVVVTSKG